MHIDVQHKQGTHVGRAYTIGETVKATASYPVTGRAGAGRRGERRGRSRRRCKRTRGRWWRRRWLVRGIFIKVNARRSPWQRNWIFFSKFFRPFSPAPIPPRRGRRGQWRRQGRLDGGDGSGGGGAGRADGDGRYGEGGNEEEKRRERTGIEKVGESLTNGDRGSQ